MQNPFSCLYFVGQGFLSVFGLKPHHQPHTSGEFLENEAGQVMGKGVQTAIGITGAMTVNPLMGIGATASAVDFVESTQEFINDCRIVGSGYQVTDEQ